MADERKVKKSKKVAATAANTSELESSKAEVAPVENGVGANLNCQPTEAVAETTAETASISAPIEDVVNNAITSPSSSAMQDNGNLTTNIKTPSIPFDSFELQRLEEKAKKAEELHAAEVKVRKELEALNAKLLAEKTALLDSLSGEKGQLQDFQERNAKLTAQKNDLENQLRVSKIISFNNIKNQIHPIMGLPNTFKLSK